MGDTVHWSATGAHTVTFPATGQDPTLIDPFGPAAGHRVYDGTSFYTSGLLNAGLGAPTSYTLTFPDAGDVPVRLRAAPVPGTARRHRRRPAAAERTGEPRRQRLPPSAGS